MIMEIKKERLKTLTNRKAEFTNQLRREHWQIIKRQNINMNQTEQKTESEE